MQPTEYAQPESNLMSYDGGTSRIYGIWIRNVLLQIVTFGIYRAWSKTNMRRYLWSCYRIDGDRLEYTGLGGELFRGFLKVYAIFFVISSMATIISALASGEPQTAAGIKHFGIGNILLWSAILYLGLFGRFSSLRYRLTRTSWRGVHGMLKGNARDYVTFRLQWLLACVLSLGYLVGRSDMMANHYIAERLYFGNQPCRYTAPVTMLDKINLVTWLLFIPTLGLSRLWYRAALLNAKYDYLQAGSIHFKASFTAGKLFRLSLGNILIILFTVFLGMPFVIQRMMRCFSDNVHVLGTFEGTAILQASANAGNLGEGIEDYLGYEGIDFDLGII